MTKNDRIYREGGGGGRGGRNSAAAANERFIIRGFQGG